MREQIKISEFTDMLPEMVGEIVLKNEFPIEFGETILKSIRKILISLYENLAKEAEFCSPPYWLEIEVRGKDVGLIIQTEDGENMIEGELRHEEMTIRECRDLAERLSTDEDLMKDIFVELTIMEREDIVDCMIAFAETKDESRVAKMMAILRDKVDVSELTDLLK